LGGKRGKRKIIVIYYTYSPKRTPSKKKQSKNGVD